MSKKPKTNRPRPRMSADEREFQRYIRKLRRDRRKAEIEEFRVRVREALGLAA